MKQYKTDVGKMWLDPKKPGISLELAKKGGREFCFMYLLEQYSKGVDLGFDIGANVGYTTIAMADRCKKVIAWEPDLRSHRLLALNTKGYVPCVELRSEAISDKVGQKTFVLAKKPNQSGFIKKSKGKETRVKTHTLDYYCKVTDVLWLNDHNSLIIKCDIEGQEIEMIDGAVDTLSKVPYVYLLMELHCKKYERTWELLKSLGFKMKYVVNAKGFLDRFTEGYELVYHPKGYGRAVFNAVPEHEAMCSQKIKGKKLIRSVLWAKK